MNKFFGTQAGLFHKFTAGGFDDLRFERLKILKQIRIFPEHFLETAILLKFADRFRRVLDLFLEKKRPKRP